MARPKKYEAFYDCMRVLRHYLPPEYPVKVRTLKPTPKNDDLAGDCQLKGKRKNERYFLIRVTRGDVEWMINTLVHEWAHALAWDADNHNDRWAKAYSKCHNLIYPHSND